MLKRAFFGFLAPAILLAFSVGAFMSLRSVEPPKVLPLGNDAASRLSVIPIVDVMQVRALTDFSDTLNISANGTVVPYREVQIASEVAGRIVEKPAKTRSGNLVKKGQLLFRIDPSDYELEVQRLKQLLEQEAATLTELNQDLANAQKMLKLADEDMKLAEAEVDRLESLPNSFASRTELDAARRNRLTSINQRTTIQNQLQTIETRRRRLELGEKLVATQLEQAQLNLSRTEILAPVDGRIVKDQAELDSYVQRGSALIMLEDTEKIEVACNVRMDQLYWIFNQAELSADPLLNPTNALFQLPSTPVTIGFRIAGRESVLYKWQGVLDRVEGAGFDPQSRTVPCRILVDEPDQVATEGNSKDQVRTGPPSLVRGMFVEVQLHAKPADRLLLIPKLGVRPGNLVWVYRPDASLLASADDSAAPSIPKSDVALAAKQQLANERIANIKPADWEVGRLEILKDTQVIGPYRTDASSNSSTVDDYWICEVKGDLLQAGMFVVVSPLPGVRGDGTDAIRAQVKQTQMQGPR
jgi:multidrug efflux pump subunit AcrA (membrane-fusion protein)